MLDELEHYGVKGMKWGRKKKQRRAQKSKLSRYKTL